MALRLRGWRMTRPSHAQQVLTLECLALEEAAHIDLLERLNAAGKRKTPPEMFAIKRMRLEALRAAYATLKSLTRERDHASDISTNG